MNTRLCALPFALIFTGCWFEPGPEPGAFSLTVLPEQMEDAVPGQICVFLVSVEDEGAGSGRETAVSISASASGATLSVEPEMISPGEIAEILVVPEEPVLAQTRQDQDAPPIIVEDEEEPWTVTLNIRATRAGSEETATVSLDVYAGRGSEDELGETAAAYRDLFIPWLSESQPELGITAETEWTSAIVRPHFEVVMYYLFFSDQWEMGVSWHVMIPPYDWSRIYLRHRFTETNPSLAFEIASTSDEGQEPSEIEPPESLWR